MEKRRDIKSYYLSGKYNAIISDISQRDKDLVTIDIPNLFIQIPIDRKPGEEKIINEIKWVLVNMLIKIDV